ncbi:hypothetical protein GX586_10200 [bacterium]|nr:hypothetical protein [bacterium]
MARPLRIEGENLWYHVLNRGNERRDVFVDDSDYRSFLNTFFSCAVDFGVEIHCFSLMPNHFHLFLMTRKANLSRYMHCAESTFCSHYNVMHERVGHVFQGRYKAIVVDTEEYGRELSRYIHLNPARSSRLSGPDLRTRLRTLRSYPWSSYRSYAGLAPSAWPLCAGKILAAFGGESAECRRNYARFIKEGLLKETDPFENVVAQSILGSDDFVDRIRQLMRPGARYDNSARHARSVITAHDLREVLLAVGAEFGVQEVEFAKQLPAPQHRSARRVALWAASRYSSGLMSLEEIGRRMGGVGGSMVSNARGRVDADIVRGAPDGRRALAVAARLRPGPSTPLALSSEADQDWIDMYQRLVAYHDRHGHAAVPPRFAADVRLGAWVERQRLVRSGEATNARPLTDRQIALLDDLGFGW